MAFRCHRQNPGLGSARLPLHPRQPIHFHRRSRRQKRNLIQRTLRILPRPRFLLPHPLRGKHRHRLDPLLGLLPRRTDPTKSVDPIDGELADGRRAAENLDFRATVADRGSRFVGKPSGWDHRRRCDRQRLRCTFDRNRRLCSLEEEESLKAVLLQIRDGIRSSIRRYASKFLPTP